MCLVAVLFHVVPDTPVVIAGNREEYFDRGGLSPQRLDGVSAIGGVDPTHRGTWLGVNSHGVVVAVTNRRKTDLPTSPRSRGLLVRELLGSPSASIAADRAVKELQSNAYAGCNLLCIDAGDGVVIQAGDWFRVRPLPAGIHVLSNRDLNDDTDQRVVHSLHWLSGRDLSSLATALNSLKEICGSHDPAHDPVCFREDGRGTVCSSLLALSSRKQDSVYLHAQGPPDVTAYDDYSRLLRDLLAPSGE